MTFNSAEFLLELTSLRVAWLEGFLVCACDARASATVNGRQTVHPRAQIDVSVLYARVDDWKTGRR